MTRAYQSGQSARPPDGTIENAQFQLGGFGTHTISDDTDSAKRFAALQAQLAMLGWVVSREASGAINCCRWGQIRTVDTLGVLEAFALQVGAQP